ncbi:MAG: LIC12162 family protein [Sulfuricella sp.]|nr:LIC12162 family protein [Sulfuricella sp.]
MFLVTTADRRYWKAGEKILFLGEWCKLFCDREYWEHLPHDTLSFYWNDRQRLYRDYQYVSVLYERYLELLAQQLNRAHATHFSLRYWRILIGPWLRFFMETLFDRYVAIKEARATNQITGTWVPEDIAGNWTPNDFPNFLKWFVADEYNQYLYGKVIRRLGGIPYEIVSSEGRAKAVSHGGTFSSRVKWLLGCCSRAVPDKFNRKVFVSSYLSLRDQIKLQLSLGQLPYFPPGIILDDLAYDAKRRSALFFNEGDDEFEVLLAALIPEQLPKLYLEGYADMHKRAMNAYPKKPELIFTANAFSENEAFKFWTACQAEAGTKFVISQHGGHYGTGLWSSTENHEIKIADTYFSWGWRSESNLNVEPHPVGKLAPLGKRKKAHNDGPILWVANTWPRYPYISMSIPVASQMLTYLDEQKRFMHGLSQSAGDALLLRLHPMDYGWHAKARWAEWFPRLKVYQGPERLSQQLLGCRLFVGTNNATTFLETLAANIPTIIFWNPDHWELRDSALPYFNELRRAGILHDTPESAADKVNEVYRNPDLWWRQTEPQRAREVFCAEFAQTSDEWMKDWRRGFAKIVAP